jgi:hypothetical protein
MLRLLFLLLIVVSHQRSHAAPSVPDTMRILFIGNSLTYQNDLPGLVKEIGEKDGKIMFCNMIALPDYSLEDHWKEGRAEEEIEKGRYDFVVMQQGPSALPESQALLLTYANKFAGVCKKQGSRMALFMVWPAKARSNDFEAVTASYFNAAQATGALFCPAGMGWLNFWELKKDVSLYGPDGFHPGLDGSLLSAMIIYATLLNRTKLDFLVHDKCSWKNKISKELDLLLKSVTISTVAQ